MPSEIHVNAPEFSGQTLYLVVWNKSGQAWDVAGAAFATYTTTRDTFDIVGSEVGTTGLFLFTLPAGAVGYVWTSIYVQSGGSPSHADDVEIAAERGYWDGLDFIRQLSGSETAGLLITATVDNVLSQTNFGISGGPPFYDNALVGQSIAIFAAAEPNSPSVRTITANAGQDTLTINAAPDFTLLVGDRVSIRIAAKIGEPVGATIAADIAGLPAATLGDPNFDAVPEERTFHLVRKETVGLVGRVKRTFFVGDTATIAIDFAEDLPTNGKLNSVGTIAIATGTAGGITFGTPGRNRSRAQVATTFVTAGDYTVKCPVTYSNGDSPLATIDIEVIAVPS